MKNNFIKKISLLVLALTLCLISVNLKVVRANQLSDMAIALNERQEVFLTDDITCYKQQIKTLFNGITDPSNSKYAWRPHTVQWVDFDTSSNLKVVTYSGPNADKWKQMTTRQAAAAWEKDNPGWIVVAGINGDFFDNSTNDGNPATYEPTNNFMQGGDMYRAEVASASYRNVIGWNADGSVIEGKPTISQNMFVKVYEDQDYTNKSLELPIASVNNTPSETGISLYTIDNKKAADLTGYKVIECSYKINRVSTHGYVFVKGSTSSTVEVTNATPANGKFYLASKDGSLDSLAMNKYVKCEYSYTGAWANVQNSCGYIYDVIKDGVIQQVESTVAHCYGEHPRTLIGFKENGETVFMVVDGRGKDSEAKIGVSLAQAGELMRLAGCVDGYSLDGGGSSTLIIRNQFGTFDVVNTPSDGGERSDGNHCLVVARDPGYYLNTDNTSYDSIAVKLDVKNADYYGKIKNIKVKVGEEVKDYKGEELVFSGLDRLTNYEVQVIYDALNVYGQDSYKTTSFKYNKKTTDYDYFDPGFNVKAISKTQIEISRDLTHAKADWIKDIVVTVGGIDYQMDSSKDKLVINNLISDTDYQCVIKYNILDGVNGVKYPYTSDAYSVKTLAFDVPVVDTFEIYKTTAEQATIKYGYTDTAGIVTKAYIAYDDEMFELTSDIGTARISGLKLNEKDYSFKLVLEYTFGGVTQMVESEVITAQKVASKPTTPSTGGMCGAKATLIISLVSSVSLLGIVLRKRK